jgi:outer membrane protein OmpA-like peptidoglycan-associated protein
MLRLAVVCLVLPMAHVRAQGTNPSVDQIIQSLKPRPETRGIRRLVPPGGASPSAPQAGAPLPSVNLTVNFAFGSADLTPEATQALDLLGLALRSPDLARYRFRIVGHTDTVGTADFNRALSERRAQAVVGYISTKYGVAGSRLEPIGMGSDRLLIPTAAQVPEPRNRRVEIINISAAD